MSCSVFQDWYSQIPWKMQSIFVNGLRAPDVASKATKKVVRWMRINSCHDADPNKPNCYMSAPPMLDEILMEQALDEMEYMSCHYVPEPRRFAVAQLDTDGTIQWDWYWPESK